MPGTTKSARTVFENVVVIDTADDGMAIGRCMDGRIILVKGAVPGDQINAEVLDKKKGMFLCRPVSFSTYSPDREIPFCSHFGLCGGCKWQHMTYSAQVRFKEKKVHDAFQRIAGLDTAFVEPIVRAPEQRYYRNKLEFTASDKRWLTEEEIRTQPEGLEKNTIGFHLPAAFDKVLDLHHCYLQADPSNAIRLFIKEMGIREQWPFFNLRDKAGYLRNIIIRNNLAREFMVVLVVGEDQRDRIEMLVEGLTSNFPQVVSIYSCVNTKSNDSIADQEVFHEFGQKTLIETLGHVKFHVGPKSFFQTNSQQALTLYSLAKDMAALQPSEHVYDLYCGVGSLGIFMADSCKHVVGIEQISEAVEDAGRNADLNGLTNTTFVTGQAELLLDSSFINQHGRPDVVITDPPRAGMHPKVVSQLMSAAPERIIYVSCNPATQARDLKLMSEKYDVQKAVPVDMFPQTHHIECVALLTINK